MKSFIHLHLHSEYSLLDSNQKISDLIKKVKEFNMPAVALTDHGSILGAVNFFNVAKKNGIKAIIGSEMYISPNDIAHRPGRGSGEANYHHLVVLVKSDIGYKNLSELISTSFIDGFYRKPRIDKKILKEHSEGLVILSSCIQGEIPYNLLRGKEEEAYKAAEWYKEVFGEDFYIEIQNHGLSQQVQVLPKLVELAKDLSIPLVATNDVHYNNRSDSDAREILICLQTNEVLSNTERAMKKETDEMYLKSTEEMEELFSDYPEAIDNTLVIAAKCNFEFRLGEYFLPKFRVPDEFSIDEYFEKICREGFEDIKGKLEKEGKDLVVYEKRLKYEIEKIREMEFPSYFLIVWDIIRFSKENDILIGPGRGSVVGSLVSYVMGITSIDPLEYDLIFERFLNPERISMPDIDLDFDPERREDVIEYIRNKYGEENVAQIVTFGKMKAKMAIRDTGRVLEVPLGDVDKLAKLIPETPNVSLREEVENNEELQKEIKRMEAAPRLIDYALKLENNIRNTGMHAAGVVIAPKKLIEFMPLYKAKDKIVTQFEKEEVEQIGLLKLDILGLKTLTIIKNILSSIKEIEKKDLDLQTIPLDDKKTFKLFQDGYTDGIFQFESSGMRDYLKRSRPQKFEDLVVLNGLYRPGPLGTGMADTYVNRKIGKEKVSYIFNETEEILKDTYGVIVFQEQVMRISQIIAGFPMSKADEMRKIMGKKQVQKLPAVKKDFMEGAAKRGFNKKKAEELFLQMSTFAQYGFNKSHSTAYANLAYQTAYLKVHFPVYFMSSLLTTESDKSSTDSKIIQYISECRKMGIEILPPDINRSFEKFRVESAGSIRYGLKGLKNVGDKAIKSFLEVRISDGEFTNYSDFITRSNMSKTNKAVIESLIKAGAFDVFGLKRRTLFESLEEVIHQASLIEKRRQKNQRSLFVDDDTEKIVISKDHHNLEEWTEAEMIQGEKEIAGMYISLNPIEKYKKEIKKISNTNISSINSGEFRGDIVRIGGVVTSFKQRKSKKGTFYGELFFEDLSGRIKLLIFSKPRRNGFRNNGNDERVNWDEIKEELKLDFPYYLKGRIPDNGDMNKNIYVEELIELETLLKKRARKIMITIDYSILNDEFSEELKKKMENHTDSTPTYLVILKENKERVIIKSGSLKPTITMKKDIEKITGKNTVEILYQ